MSVAVILGAGSKVGKSVATKLVANGYKVALVSRTGSGDATKDTFPIKADLAVSSQILGVFDQVEKQLGAPPSIVIYNAAGFSRVPVEDDPFSVSEEALRNDLNVGALGVYTALQAALASWRKLNSPNQPKVFIATSNLLGVEPGVPAYLTLGAGKRLLSYFIEIATKSSVYAKEGFRFYAASQAKNKLEFPGPEFNGEAHAVAYWDLVNRKEQGDWDVRFDKDGKVFE